jgi:hemolysin activation/secretion protein
MTFANRFVVAGYNNEGSKTNGEYPMAGSTFFTHILTIRWADHRIRFNMFHPYTGNPVGGSPDQGNSGTPGERPKR